MERQGLISRTIESLMAGLGKVVLLGLVELAVQLGPVMKFQATRLAVDRGAMVHPPVMEAGSQVNCAAAGSLQRAEAALLWMSEETVSHVSVVLGTRGQTDLGALVMVR